VDAQIGKVLAELDALGLRESTVVVLLGDHGYNLGEHTLWCKHCNFNTSLQVPLIIDAPGLEAGRTRSLAALVDIYPTLTELLGLAAPEGQLEGESLVPVLRDPEAKVKDFVVARWMDGISLRTDEHLYTQWMNDDGTVRARMLFDHRDDPAESVNLAADPENAALVSQMQASLEANWGKNFWTQPAEITPR
jgi:arylsulfatase A-like enzyme